MRDAGRPREVRPQKERGTRHGADAEPEHRYATRPLGRRVRRPHPGPHGLAGASSVRRGVPARGGVARGRHAVRVRAPARRHGRHGRPPHPRPRRCRAAVRLGPGRRDAARADPRGDGAGRRARAPGRHRGHGRLSDGARPRRARVLRPRRRDHRRGPDLRHRARGVLGVPVRGRARSDGRAGHAPRRAARGHRLGARAGEDPQADLHDPVVPQPWRRHPGAGAPARGARGRTVERHPAARGRPVRAAGLRRHRAAGDPRRRGRGRDLPRHVLQDDRRGPARGLGGGSARRAREARAGQRDSHPLPVELLPARRSPSTSPPSRGWTR